MTGVPRDLLAYVCRHAEDPEALKLCEKYAGPLGAVISGARRWLWTEDVSVIKLAEELGLKVYKIGCGHCKGAWISLDGFHENDLVEAALVGALILYAAEKVIDPSLKPGFMVQEALRSRIRIDEPRVPGVHPELGLAPPHRQNYVVAYSLLMACVLHSITRLQLIVYLVPGRVATGMRQVAAVLSHLRSMEWADMVYRIMGALAALAKVPVVHIEKDGVSYAAWVEEVRRLASSAKSQIHAKRHVIMLTSTMIDVVEIDERIVDSVTLPHAANGRCGVGSIVLDARRVYAAFEQRFKRY